MDAIYTALLGHAVSMGVEYLTPIIVSIVIALIGHAWHSARNAIAAKAEEKATVLGKLADIASRAGAQLNAVIIADPMASGAIEAAKTKLVDEMTSAVSGSLRRIGGDRAGVEKLILGKAAEVLATQAATAIASSVANPAVRNPTVTVADAMGALARAGGLVR
jgi:hypothetical protein